jgi:hypothetical protein
VCDIWPCITNIAVRLSHDTNMFVGIEESVFLVATASRLSRAHSLEGLETGIGENHDEPLGVLVGRGDGHMLLGN